MYAYGIKTHYKNAYHSTFTWENGRQLKSAAVDGQTVQFRYDTSGVRIGKTAGSTTWKYTVENGKVLYENNGSIAIRYYYDENGSPFAVYIGSAKYLYEKNLQGDIIGLIDENGQLAVKYTYDAWGKVTKTNVAGTTASTSAMESNHLLYRGYYFDSETGLYYLGGRYYDPETGRFINADDTSNLGENRDFVGYNLFAYCGNNPVIRVDSKGHFWETALDIISLSLSIAEVMACPTDPWAWIGLTGDVVDLIPVVTGVGEVTRAVEKAVKNGDELLDFARNTKKAFEESTGVYEIIFSSGKNYVGKGGYQRMINSGKRIQNKYKDEIAVMMWKPAQNDKEAFIGEYLLQTKRRVLKSRRDAATYNVIWSPGRNYFRELF